MLCHGTVCVVGKIRDLILQLSKSSIYSTKPTESIKKIYFDRYRVIVGIDTEGNTLQKQEVRKYAR
ncbi:TPA: hypothetical protein ME528_005390 [Klebsiella pneumoniae]|nr:hypothetical protein [Klebsiella pneumoniae]